MPASISGERRRYRPITSTGEPLSRVRGTATSTAPIVVRSRRRYVPFRTSLRADSRCQREEPIISRATSSSTVSRTRRTVPRKTERRSYWKFSCVGSSSSATSSIGKSPRPRRQARPVHWWFEELPFSFHPPRVSDSHKFRDTNVVRTGGDLRARVTERLLDGAEVHARLPEQRGVRVTEIVEADPSGNGRDPELHAAGRAA